ncbi:MAG: TlyA family rRNA (cytidine-2'-O)-methyltransferase [Desulfobacterium sp.]|nr:TlyA family rRNA (cytidine-2'-O)-methyltransferase [Desulfobacterium sp.]
MPSVNRKPLDLILFEKKLVSSRQLGKSFIMAGKVMVDNRKVDKPGTLIHPDSNIEIIEDLPFVSRGGFKLLEGLSNFHINPEGMVCLDVGASTGGFTDCLLQKGANTVFSVDVSYGQLAWKLRTDPRVVVIERANIRELPSDALPGPVDLVTIDVSFISLRIVIPAVLKFMKNEGNIIALIKPQFEIKKGKVGKGGVVRDPEDHRLVIQELMVFFNGIGLKAGTAIPSPILGPKGNKEFLIHLHRKSSEV